MKHTIKKQIALLLIFSATTGQVFGAGPDLEISLSESPSSDWEFRLEPYLWAPGLYGSVGARGINADLDKSTIDILEDLKIAAAMQFEARYHRWGFIMDGFYADVGSSGNTPGPLYSSANVDLKQFIGEVSVAYRIFESPKGFVDIYGGFRYNNLSIDLNASLNVPGIDMVSANVSERIVSGITERAEAIVQPKIEEFKMASAARRDEIASEIQAKVKAEAENRLKETIANRIKRIRRDGELNLRDVQISRIVRSVKAQRLEVARSNAELAAARIRAAADAANKKFQDRVLKAQARVQKAEDDLSKGISQGLQNNLPKNSSGDQEWVDPIIGVRAQWNFHEKWYLTGKSDIGGFGVGSDLTWSIQSTVGYSFTENVSAEIGYQYLDTDYSDGDFSYDVAEHGIFLGVNFLF